MSFLRSEEMGLYKLMFEYNDRWKVMENIGELSALHFVDVNSNGGSRQEKIMLSRCENCEKMISYLTHMAEENKIPIPSSTNYSDMTYELDEYSRTIYQTYNVDCGSMFDHIERDVLQKISDSVHRDTGGLSRLYDDTNQLQMHCYALEIAKQKFIKQDAHQHFEYQGIKAVKTIAVVDHNSSFALQKLLFRTLRGNVIIGEHSLPQPLEKLDGTKEYKTAILVIYKDGENTKERVTRACTAYADLQFDIPENIDETLLEKKTQLQQMFNIRDRTKQFLIDSLKNILNGSDKKLKLQTIKYFIDKFKAINTTLSKMVICGGVYEGLCYCPSKNAENVISQIKRPDVANAFFMPVQPRPSYPSPPTFIRENDFLGPFQQIVNTYGIPSYREINPALFTIISFPFLFGIMFGDILHGSILLFIGVYLLWTNPKTLKQTSSFFYYFYPYRYLILLLGIFATYCGFIYNEVGALPLTLFKSCFNENGKTVCTYPFGFDYKWKLGSNELQFTNSFKMKFAIIIAFSHMMLGIVLKGFNAMYFGSATIFFCEFLPEMIFTVTLIGYLTFLIIYKWLSAWPQGSSPPSILTLFGNVFLSPTTEPGPAAAIFGSRTQLFINTSLFGIFL